MEGRIRGHLRSALTVASLALFHRRAALWAGHPGAAAVGQQPRGLDDQRRAAVRRLDGDHRRRGDALEFGHDWRGPEGRYRVCWYQETGELTAERLSDDQSLDLENFHQGISGPVYVIARIPSRAQLDRLVGTWPNIVLDRPHTIARLRQLLAGRPRLLPVPDA